MQIITEVKHKAKLRRFMRMFLGLMGNLLILAGLISATPIVMLLLLSIAFLGQADLGDIKSETWGKLFLFGLGAVIGIITGLRLKRGRRRLVLFLRRFGFSGSSKTLSFASSTAIGQRWRLVTLDDAAISPIGVSSRTRILFKSVSWLTLFLVIIGMVYGMSWIQGEGSTEMVNGIFNNAIDGFKAQGYNIFFAIFAALIVTLLIGILGLGIVLLLIFLPTATMGVATIFTWGARRSVHRAEKTKIFNITEATGIEYNVSKLIKRMKRIFAPRLVVAKVAQKIWRQVVEEFATKVDVILIDVSEPSGNLLWEIKMFKQYRNSNWILVGHEERVLRMSRIDGKRHPSIVNELKMLLDGEEVLVYKGEDRSSMRQFSIALRDRLENLVILLKDNREN